MPWSPPAGSTASGSNRWAWASAPYDPPVLPAMQVLSWLRPLGPVLHRPLLGLLKGTIRSWGKPWHRLRADLGLPAVRENPLFEGQHSPSLVLALFSRQLGPPQP